MPRGGKRPGAGRKPATPNRIAERKATKPAIADLGGKRPGAGRKPGVANQKTRLIADMAAAEGITPLEVMLALMRRHYAEGNYDEAADRARDAAPYMHPKLGAVTVAATIDADPRMLSDAELEARIARLSDNHDRAS